MKDNDILEKCRFIVIDAHLQLIFFFIFKSKFIIPYTHQYALNTILEQKHFNFFFEVGWQREGVIPLNEKVLTHFITT